MTTASIVTAAIASYAAIVSTLSLVLAIRAHRTGGPIIDLDWRYLSTTQELLIILENTGRGDITVSDLELFITRVVVTSRSGKAFNLKEFTLKEIPRDDWCVGSSAVQFPVRLASNSTVDIKVDKDAIRPLPADLPRDELRLKFVAVTPQGRRLAWVRGDVLWHFVAFDPQWPIVLPS